MLTGIKTVANEDFLQHFPIIGFWSLFIRYIYKYKASKYLNIAKVLAYISLSSFRYNLFVISAFYKESILKVIDSLYCFNLEIIGEFTVNKHYIFHNNNDFLSLFGKTVFFIHIWGPVFDCNSTLLTKVIEFNQDKFSSTICS